MFEHTLLIITTVSAIMSVGLGIAFRYTLRRLGELGPQSHTHIPHKKITVIVPARNEAADLRSSVESLLAQDEVELSVVIVNDHSTDGTAEIADSLAADSRVRVIHDPPLTAGWLGKANAMQHGFLATTSEVLVFSDADVLHRRRCFATVLAEMSRQQADLISVCPRFISESFWENVTLPHCLVAGMVQFFFPSVNNPQSSAAGAAGALMMARRSVLEEIGGLACIKSAMLDDVELARAVKRHGAKVCFHIAPELLQVRLFKGNHHAFWGLTKNILGGVDNFWMALPAMFLPVFVYWGPLLAVWIGWARRRPILAVAGAAAYAIQLGLVFMSRRIVSVRFPAAAFFPLGAFPVFCCFVRALYHRLRDGTVVWRGRAVSVTESLSG